MTEKSISVVAAQDGWRVEIHSPNATEPELAVTMSSREDAVRYARVSEQRTGIKIAQLPSQDEA